MINDSVIVPNILLNPMSMQTNVGFVDCYVPNSMLKIMAYSVLASVAEAQMGVRWSMIDLWWLGRLNGGGLMTSVDHASELVIHVMVSRALKLSVGLNLLVLLFFVSFLTSPRVRARVRDHWWNQRTSSLQWNMHSKWDKNCTYSE